MNRFLLAIVAAMALVAIVPAKADEVRLKNGDRLSGTVIKKTDEWLFFDTEYAGEIAIEWEHVVTVEINRTVDVVLADGTRLKGSLAPEGDEMVVFPVGEEESVPTPPAHVEAIIPPEVRTLYGFRLAGRVAAGLNASRGNTDTDQIYLDGEASARKGNIRAKMAGRWRREEDEGERTASNWRVTSTYDQFLTDKWYFFRNGNLSHDRFQDLNLRIAGGAGFGYQFFDSEALNLSVEAGPNLVNEDFIDAPDRTYVGGRWALNFDKMLFADTIQVFHNHDGLVNLEDTEDVLVNSESGVRVPLVHGVEATAQVNVEWRNKPAPGNDSTDTTFIVTGGYRW